MSNASNSIRLKELMATGHETVDPSAHPSEVFELFSIPAYDVYQPDVIEGSAIGSAKKRVEPGDVLLSRIVPHIRRAWVVPRANGHRQIASGEWIIFRSTKFNASYLRHLLMSDVFHAQFMNTVAGVGGSLLRARPSFVADIEIPLPPLSEQKRIADILDNADGIRRKRREVKTVSDSLLPSLFSSLFGHTGSKYRSEPLDNHLSFLTSGSRGWAEHYVASGKRFLRSLDVQMNRIGSDEIVFVNPPPGTEADRTRVQDGDVLITITGSRIGRVAFVPDSFGEAYVSQHVAIARLKPTLRARYCSLYLSLPDGGQRQISKAQYGQTKPGISLANIRDFKIPIPPVAEQDRFLTLWDRLAAVTQSHSNGEAEANDLFNALVQRAFKGEL
ncbi:MAG: restriction endonuclease subunit S [Pirellulaceae bacterium]